MFIFSAGNYTPMLKHDACGQISLKVQKPLYLQNLPGVNKIWSYKNYKDHFSVEIPT